MFANCTAISERRRNSDDCSPSDTCCLPFQEGDYVAVHLVKIVPAVIAEIVDDEAQVLFDSVHYPQPHRVPVDILSRLPKSDGSEYGPGTAVLAQQRWNGSAQWHHATVELVLDKSMCNSDAAGFSLQKQMFKVRFTNLAQWQWLPRDNIRPVEDARPSAAEDSQSISFSSATSTTAKRKRDVNDSQDAFGSAKLSKICSSSAPTSFPASS